MIGNTPLVYLREVSEATNCEIYGKAEFLNPGGSIKDRTALGLIRDAETKGELQPGGTIVEGTAGNTGIGLTLLANALGYKCVVVMPQTQSKEKREVINYKEHYVINYIHDCKITRCLSRCHEFKIGLSRLLSNN